MSKKVMLSVWRYVYFKFFLSRRDINTTLYHHTIVLFFKIHFPHAKGDKISFVVFVARVSKGLPRNEFFQILKKGFKFLKSFPFWKFCGNSTIVKFGIWKVTGANSSLRANYTSRAGSWSQFLFKREGPIKMRHFSDETKYWVLIHFDGHF